MLIKRSIRNDILIFLLGIVLILIIITASLEINSIITIGNYAQKITSISLNNQTEKFLVQLAVLTAEKNDIILEAVREDAGNVAEYVKNIFDNTQAFASDAHWKFDENVFIGNDGQHLNGPVDASSVFIPNYVKIDDDIKKEIEMGTYLDYMSSALLENELNMFAVYFIGLHGELIYYPNKDIGNNVPPDIDFTKEIFFTVANPENDSERKVVWTPLYDDLAGQGLMITASAPIYTKKGFFGVLSIDVTLNTISSNIEKYNPIEDSYSFLIDKKGRAIALPDKAYNDILGRARKPGEYGIDIVNTTNEFSIIINKMKEGSTGFQSITINNKELYVAYAPLESTGFSFGIVVEKVIMLKAVSDLQKEMENSTQKMIYSNTLPAGLLILTIVWIIGLLYIQRIIKPIKDLTKTAEEISKGNLNVKVDVKTRNEIGQLASSFNKMTKDLKVSKKELENYTKELEEKVKKRTSQLDKKIKESEETKIATLNILEDVDETRQKLAKTYNELKKLDKMKAEFMNISAHELKTPLIPIIGYLDMIIRGEMGKINPKEKESLAIALRSAQRLQRLVGDILDISKLETATMKFYIDDVSLTVLISNLVESMKPFANEKKIKLTSKTDKNLPIIKGDISRLTEVFENLINNAIKFTEKGEVLIESKIEDKNIIISVKDSGIGMSKEFIKKKLFKKFQQEDSTERRKYGGTGLGLVICKGIVERHKGRIWVESEVGKGSTFYVSFPIKK